MPVTLRNSGIKFLKPPKFDLSSSAFVTDEGTSVAFTFMTDGPDGTFYWKTGGTVGAADFTDHAVSGTFSTSAGVANIVRTLRNDLLTEGTETVQLQVNKDSHTGKLLATSTFVDVNDTSLTYYAISASSPTVSEGESVTFTLTSTGPDETLYWTSSGTSTGADFTDGLTNGSFSITAGTGSIVRSLKNDLLTEGNETLLISIRKGSITGVTLVSSSVSITDTSLTQYSLTASTGSVNEGGSVTFSFTTTGPDGTFYWTNSGTTGVADFSDGLNSGSFVTSAGTGSIVRTLSSDMIMEGSETITLQARTSGFSGTIVATSPSVTVNDTSFVPGIFPNWTVGAGGDFATLDAALASPSVTDGHYIKMLPGIHLLTGSVTMPGYGLNSIIQNYYTAAIMIEKQVYIGGTPNNRQDVILDVPASIQRDATLYVAADNVLLKDLTIRGSGVNADGRPVVVSKKQVYTSGASPKITGGIIRNFIMDSCDVIKNKSTANLSIWGNKFKVANCNFIVTGTDSSYTAYIAVHNATTHSTASNDYSGINLFKNNMFVDNTTQTNMPSPTPFVFTRSLRGDIIVSRHAIGAQDSIELERFGGRLVIEGSTHSSSNGKRPGTFLLQDHFTGSDPFGMNNLGWGTTVYNGGAYFLMLKNNTVNEFATSDGEGSAFVSFKGFENGFGDGIGGIYLDGNTLTNRHRSSGGGKGMISIERREYDWNVNPVSNTGARNWRVSTTANNSLEMFPVYLGTNTIASSTFMPGFTYAIPGVDQYPVAGFDQNTILKNMGYESTLSVGGDPAYYRAREITSTPYIASSSVIFFAGGTTKYPLNNTYTAQYTEPTTPNLF